MLAASEELWGKWGDGGRAIYPLVAHLADTAAFARVLLDRWLPRRVLSAVGESPAVATAVNTAAALHDLGKATSVFQTQALTARKPDGIGAHAVRLADAGLAGPSDALDRNLGDLLSEEQRVWVRRHEVASAAMLAGQLDRAGSRGLAAVVAGHHGRWNLPDASDPWGAATFCAYGDWMLHDPAWAKVRDEIIATVAGLPGVDPDVEPPPSDVVPLLTGIVVVADWLASDLADRDPVVDPSDWQAHYERRLDDATLAVDELLGTPVKPEGGFTDRFGFAPDRPVQRQLVRDGQQAGLRVVMVPTGDGKTEAALGHWMVNADDRQGLFFALPSMATADAMFSRIRDLFEGTGVFGALAHGRSMLNQFYADTPRQVRGEVYDEGCDDGMRAGEWFHSSKRAVLAPVTVGTADQLLLGAVRHRYNFLRMLGAATKTVVFDEVHSYDPYMARLLEQFLRWAGRFNIDVLLLSATLPTEQLHAYVDAYGGALEQDAAYPGVVTVDGQGATVPVELDASDAARTLTLDHHVVDDPAGGTVELVRDLRAQHPDAKIGVIVNTVGRCQAIAADLDGRAERPRIDGDLHVMHSRFTADRRASQAADAVGWYGKRSVDGPAVMVATQVVEQSVDVDFDILVTDLCPAPSLIQRAGRLHRHDLNDADRDRTRPAGCASPTVHVVVPAAVNDDDQSAWQWLPYPSSSVLATWRDGFDRGQVTRVRVPDDVQALVDRSHVPLDRLLEDDVDEQQTNDLLARTVQRDTASRATVPTPADLARRPRQKLPEYASADDDVSVQTRWIEQETVDLLIVGDRPDAWRDQVPDTRPGRALARELLGAVVSVPASHADKVGERCRDRPASWDQTLLTDVVVAELTDGAAFDLDPLLGFYRKDR